MIGSLYNFKLVSGSPILWVIAVGAVVALVLLDKSIPPELWGLLGIAAGQHIDAEPAPGDDCPYCDNPPNDFGE